MSTITTKNGTQIYYKDWGKGPVVTFSHGWPLNSDAWDGQMLFLAQNGFRVVAHDRRGHGRSSQASSGNDMNGYADDLAAVIEALDLKEATLVGHSTGGGEVARYIAHHGTKRVAPVPFDREADPLKDLLGEGKRGKARWSGPSFTFIRILKWDEAAATTCVDSKPGLSFGHVPTLRLGLPIGTKKPGFRPGRRSIGGLAPTLPQVTMSTWGIFLRPSMS
jgi:pimeloyl-ACP methyl ester carboxylesterase